MARTRPVWVQIVIGVLAILFTIAVLVGWNIVFTSYYVLSTRTADMPDLGAGYWVILSFGSLFLVLVVVTILLLVIGNVRQTLYVNQQNAFVDNVTHELKSPLASLSLSIETLESRNLPPEMHARFVSMMKKDVERLRTFIEHVLDAGRLEQGQRDLREQQADLAQLATGCAARIRERHELADDEIVIEPSDLPPFPVITDRVAVETIFLNLLDNAVKYSPRPAHITFNIEASPRRAVISVSDRGVGIPPAELKKIFRRFYRVPREGRTVQGTGLGLYVVSAILRRMGGRIAVASAGPDQGATFTVELPVSQPADQTPMATS